jgi:outer membrane biosynthesis protein TonB
MRVGLATSLIAHVVLITIGVIGLHQAEELQPMEVEAISVELVPIEEVASIRAGSEQSTVIETPAPAAVDTPNPAQLAERPGATEKDQPTPAETPEESPAPTVETAPEPAPVPETTAEPENTPPPPAPEPQPAQQVAEVPPTPELATEPADETPTTAPTPAPAMRTAAIEVQRAEHNPAPVKTEPQKTEPPKESKPADEVANIINTETSRGTTTGSGGQAAAGKPTGQAARLTQSELGALIAQMRRCWNPTLAERNDGVVIHLLVAMNSDGTVSGMPEILTDLSASPLIGISARTAARKVQQCGPFNLPADKFDHWRQIDVTLDASQAN